MLPKFFEQWISNFGLPDLITDSGTDFFNQEIILRIVKKCKIIFLYLQLTKKIENQ